MIELWVSPSAVVANSSMADPQTVQLTLTVKNASTAAVDASGGVTIEFPVDPGPNAQGSLTSVNALLLSTLSSPDASTTSSGTPVPLVTVVATAKTADWTITQQATAPLTFQAQPGTAAAGTIAAGGYLTFTFDYVAPDLVEGYPVITAIVQSSSGGTTTLTRPIQKFPAPLSINSFTANPAQLTMSNHQANLADNQAYLTWTTTSAEMCTLSWSPPTGATVTQTVNNQQVPLQTAPTSAAGQAITATLTEETTFTLDAYGPSGAPISSSVTVNLSAPKFTAVTVPPLISGLSPAAGGVAGGEQVTITGTGLTGATSIGFGKVFISAGFTVTDDNTITVTAPAGTGPGSVDVSVATPAGLSPLTLMSRYGYAAADGPVVSGVVVTASGRPAGNPAGGEQVTITGTGFTGATAVNFGTSAVAAGGFAVADDDGTITATAPAGAGTGTGTVDVTVTTSNGTSPASAATCYTYLKDTVPFVSAIASRIPDGDQSYAVPLYGGDPAGGETVRITGTTADTTTGIGFATAVNFGTATTTAITPVAGSSTEIDVITPKGTSGSTVDVTVTTPGGDESPAVPAGSFTYATALTTVAPLQPFRLIWSCYDGSGPHLSWSADTNAVVSVIPETAIATINSSDPLPTTTGAAIASMTTGSVSGPVSTTATFQPGQDTAIGGSLDPIIVNVSPLTVVSDFMAGQPVTDPATGTQTVTFSWLLANATSFTITQDTTQTNLAPTQSSCQLTLPMPLAVTTYTFTATGFGTHPPYTKTVQVTPNAVSVTSFVVYGPYVSPTGQQSVFVSWQAANATKILVTAGYGVVTTGPLAGSTSVLLEPPPSPPQPAQYPVELVAEGFQPQLVKQQVTPVQVRLLSFTASSLAITRGDSVTLSWSATAATGFSLAGDIYPATTQQVTLSPKFTATYTLIAAGYTAGTQFPSSGPLTVTVSVPKDKEHGKESIGPVEKLRPKEDNPRIPGAALPADDESELSGPDQAGQQPFIRPDERPGIVPPAQA
jgi:hypothetical protein